jgi:hypothetical protein
MNEFEQAISDSLMNSSEHEPGDKETYFASELPFCLRKLTFNRHFGMRIAPNSKMALGTLLHTHISGILKGDRMAKFYKGKAMQFEVACRTTVEGVKISGHCDVLVGTMMLTGDGEKLMPELVEEWKFSRSAVRSGDDLPIYYGLQVNCYCSMLNAEQWRVVIVDPDTFNVTVIEGKADKKAAEMTMLRATKVYDIFKDEEHPIHLLGTNYKSIIKNAKSPSLRPLLDALITSLPDGPEYEFECKTRSATCPFYDICHIT